MRLVLILLMFFSGGADAARSLQNKAPARNLRITIYQGENPVDESSVTTGTASFRTLLVQDGSPAYVETGESVNQEIVGTGPYGVTVTPGHMEAKRGFYVLPRLSGNRVTLRISAVMDRPLSGNMEIRRFSTRVSGKLGDWLEISGNHDNDTVSTESENIWIRVDAP